MSIAPSAERQRPLGREITLPIALILACRFEGAPLAPQPTVSSPSPPLPALAGIEPPRIAGPSALDRPVLDLVEGHAEHQGIPGLGVAVVFASGIVHHYPVGVADLDTPRHVSPQTRFDVGSITKLFTATTVQVLAGQNRLDLRRSIDEAMGRGGTGRGAALMHVEDLLTHATGLPHDSDVARYKTSARLLADAGFRMLSEAPPFEVPHYSNVHYQLLETIVEHETGEPFRDLVRSLVFDPLGIRATWDADEASAPIAVGYGPAGGTLEPIEPQARLAGYAAGGLLASTDDLARWVAAVLASWRDDEGALGADARRLLRDGQVLRAIEAIVVHARDGRATAVVRGYGYGWRVSLDCDEGLTLSHGGSAPGFDATLLVRPDRGVAVIVLANRMHARTPQLAEAILEVALRSTERQPPRHLLQEDQVALVETFARFLVDHDVEQSRLFSDRLLARNLNGELRSWLDVHTQGDGTCRLTDAARDLDAGALAVQISCEHREVYYRLHVGGRPLRINHVEPFVVDEVEQAPDALPASRVAALISSGDPQGCEAALSEALIAKGGCGLIADLHTTHGECTLVPTTGAALLGARHLACGDRRLEVRAMGSPRIEGLNIRTRPNPELPASVRKLCR